MIQIWSWLIFCSSHCETFPPYSVLVSAVSHLPPPRCQWILIWPKEKWATDRNKPSTWRSMLHVHVQWTCSVCCCLTGQSKHALIKTWMSEDSRPLRNHLLHHFLNRCKKRVILKVAETCLEQVFHWRQAQSITLTDRPRWYEGRQRGLSTATLPISRNLCLQSHSPPTSLELT